MMKRPLINLLITAGVITAAASTPTVSWRLLPADENDGRCIGRFTFNNMDSVERVCFTQLPRPMKAVSAGDSLGEINAGYYFITSPRFGGQDKDINIDIECEWPLRSISECPESFQAMTASGEIRPIRVITKPSLSDAAMHDRAWSDWILSPDSIYRLNTRLSTGQLPDEFDLIPSFKHVEPREGFHKGGVPVDRALIQHSNPEYYRITLTPDKAIVEGASDKGIVIGTRALQRIMEGNAGKNVRCAVIEDWPDYPYRGLMIDIARNFQSPETMRHIADLMADYRLNTLHFHLTDDEGWRLEIPGLPELTEIGARRGYTSDSREYLPDIFAGTGRAEDNLPTANGYFTRDEFIDFIRYCDSIGIAVIPEIESPGHARAAVKAMETRYLRTGDDTYRLIEDNDTSTYSTAQFYHDNLMNPAVGGTYRFIGKVVDEIASMYADAGVALPGIHLGGDEVPEGAWDGSRAVASMMEERGLNSRHAVQGEYVRNISGLMRERGIPLYGWQDICTDYDADFHAEVAPTVGGMDCWVSSPEIEKNVAVKGVKAGYPVIISNVDYFYMDMLYSPNPEEKGLYWGGFTDELRTLSGYPDVICPRDGEEPGKVIGVSGKLFAETIRDKADMERLLFPKSLGLAERGWNATPTYSDKDFNILIATKELPRLSAKDVEFHLRQPGIIVEDERIKMNSPYPDAAIFYTLDGSTPTAATAALYEGPVDLPADCAIVKAILYKDGKSSVTTTYKSN